MQYNRELIAHKLQRWDDFISSYHLPDWEAIPDFGLYMDQVVVLLEQYLSFIPAPSAEKERFITAATINNYVRLKIMPAPVKRKYYRVHIAYLIMILTMKQGLSISDVQKIVPHDLPQEEVQQVYRYYCDVFRQLALFFVGQVKNASRDICDPDNTGSGNHAVELLVIESGLVAGFSKILAEKLVRLSEADPETVLAAEKPNE